MTTNPIAGNQSYTGVSNAVEQFTELNTSNLNVSKELTLGGGLKVSVANLENASYLTASPDDSNVFLVNDISTPNSYLQLPPAKLGQKVTFVVRGNMTAELRINAGEYDTLAGWINDAGTVGSLSGTIVGMKLGVGCPVGTTLSMTAINDSDGAVNTLCWMVKATCAASGGVVAY